MYFPEDKHDLMKCYHATIELFKEMTDTVVNICFIVKEYMTEKNLRHLSNPAFYNFRQYIHQCDE